MYKLNAYRNRSYCDILRLIYLYPWGAIKVDILVSFCMYYCTSLHGLLSFRDQGCTCPDNRVLYDGECIEEKKCPCYDDDGNVVLPGFEITKTPCETW